MHGKLARIMDKFRYLWYLIVYGAALLLCPFLRRSPKYRDLWIIAERGVDARDNASHLFRYIRQNHPEINICYIISRDSADREKMAALGRVVDYRSFRHYLALAASRVKISTHIMGFSPDMYFFKCLDKVFPLGGKKIFLQHGIIKDDLPYLYGSSVNLDLFVCGAQREWEYVNSIFGHPEGVAQYLGLCRYDRLPCERQEKNKVLLLMPTWRLYLSEGALTDAQFMESEYYRVFQGLLENPRLERMLAEHGYTLKFYPHFGVQQYLHCFRTGGAHIQIADTKRLGVQEALIEADALLTDFSSVFFDYGFMMKPVLHYQFDEADFRKNHYAQGYFDYRRDGFGPVCTEEAEFLDALEELLKSDCELEPEYRARLKKFFPVRDHGNCERNFRAIEKLWKEA